MGLVLLAGVAGFWAAVLGLAAFDMTWAGGLSLWLASGPAGATLALLRGEGGCDAAPRPLLAQRLARRLA